MIANHIHDALEQVKTLQEMILAKQFFRGYSGKSRILSGVMAIAGAAVLGSGKIPETPMAHLLGWGAVLAAGLVLNYAALLYWFLFDPKARRNPAMLKPAIDAIPALGVGAVLSLALIIYGQFDLLFGMWMCMYGLAQVAYRRSLPRGIYLVGIGYIVCGTCSLLLPGVSFLNPWPMGIVFFLGEQIGGVVLIVNEMADERMTESGGPATLTDNNDNG